MVEKRERRLEASYTAKRQEYIRERGEKERRQGINDAFSAPSVSEYHPSWAMEYSAVEILALRL